MSVAEPPGGRPAQRMMAGSRRSRAVENWIGFATTLRREIQRVLRIWPQTLLPPLVTTALYFVIFGPILGDRIGAVGGYGYLQYVAPGLLMMAMLTNSYQNVVSSLFGAKFQHHIEEVLVSPMSANALLLGYALGGVFRGLVIGALLAVIAVLFVDLPVAHPLLMFAVASLTAAAFAFAGFVNAMVARNFDDISVVPTFVLTPLTMLGGVFYSVEMLSDFWREVSFANPVLYVVEAFRHALLGSSGVPIETALLVLSTLTVGSYATALWMLHRGIGIRS